MECNNCGKKIRDNSKFCPFCGMKINDEVPKVPLPKENLDSTDIIADEKNKGFEERVDDIKDEGAYGKNKSDSTYVCKNCKKEIQADLNFCPYCGTKINLEVPISQKAEQGNHTINSEFEKCEKNIQNKENVNDYYLYSDLKYRDYLTKVLSIVKKVGFALLEILFVLFIVSEINDDENYKLTVYIIRYFALFGKYWALYFFIAIANDVMQLKRDDLESDKNGMIYIVLKIIICLLFLRCFGPFIIVSDQTLLTWFGTIAFGDTSDFVKLFSSSILSAIAAFVLSGVAQCLLKSEKEE